MTEHDLHAASSASDAAACTSPTGPTPTSFPFDADLHAGMGYVRDACSTLLSLRKAEGLRVRLPLAKASSPAPDADAASRRTSTSSATSSTSSRSSSPTEVDRFGSQAADAQPEDARAAPRRPDPGRDQGPQGRRLVASTATRRRASAASSCCRASSTSGSSRPATARSRTLKDAGGWWCSTPRSRPSSRSEGRARDLIRQIQQARRDAGLDVSDRIELDVDGAGRRRRRASRRTASWSRARRWRPSLDRRSTPTAAPGDATVVPGRDA